MFGNAGYLDNVIHFRIDHFGGCHARHSLAFRRSACCRDRSDGDARHLTKLKI